MKKILLFSLGIASSFMALAAQGQPTNPDLSNYIKDQVNQGIVAGLRPYLNESKYDNLAMKIAGAGIIAGSFSSLVCSGVKGLWSTRKSIQQLQPTEDAKKILALKHRSAWWQLGTGVFAMFAGLYVMANSQNIVGGAES